MKPANLAWSVAVLAAACAPEPPPVVVPAPVVTIASPPPPPPPPVEPPPVAPPPLQVAAAAVVEAPDAVRDERRYPAYARALMVTRIQNLESMYASMRKAAPERPEMMRNLADAYVELAWGASTDPAGEKLVRAARNAALKYYRLLHDQYPKWCRAPSAADPQRGKGCDDEVLYDLALEAERDHQLDLARKTTLELIQSYPQSRYIPAAYLSFGEMFMVDAARDPSKLPLAEQSYLEVVKYPPPENVWWRYAQYRLAEVYVQKHDDPRALSSLVKAVSAVGKLKVEPILAAAVRREMVEVFARTGDRAKARAFFARFASGPELEEMLSALDQHRPAP